MFQNFIFNDTSKFFNFQTQYISDKNLKANAASRKLTLRFNEHSFLCICLFWRFSSDTLFYNYRWRSANSDLYSALIIGTYGTERFLNHSSSTVKQERKNPFIWDVSIWVKNSRVGRQSPNKQTKPFIWPPPRTHATGISSWTFGKWSCHYLF